MKGAGSKSLFYITHVDNAGSIVKRGVLAHSAVELEKVLLTPICDTNIVAKRRVKYQRGPLRVDLGQTSSAMAPSANLAAASNVGVSSIEMDG